MKSILFFKHIVIYQMSTLMNLHFDRNKNVQFLPRLFHNKGINPLLVAVVDLRCDETKSYYNVTIWLFGLHGWRGGGGVSGGYWGMR